MLVTLRLGALLVVAVAMQAGCASPPTKELSQAEGAIEAARAAGAATYASAELTAAEETLARANVEVTERDYRAALGHALDASARAQAAATAAVNGRVTARLAADQALDDFAALIDRVGATLAAPEAKRVPAAARVASAAVVASAVETLERARAAVERDELAVLHGLPAQSAALEAAMTAPAAPSRRASRPRQ